MPRVALITDLSSLGKSSLTVMAPALEMLGVEACPVATALLSTQTDGFLDPVIADAGGPLDDILASWTRMGFRFDAVYTGYFLSRAEIDAVARFLDSQKDALYVCDPVLGDDGEAYQGIAPDVADGVRSVLLPRASLATPNVTEASLLVGKPWEQITKEDLQRVLGKHFAVTGCQDGERWRVVTDEGDVPFEHYPRSYPGCGDLYDAVLIGLLLKQTPFLEAAGKAATLVALAVSRTLRERRLGVDVGTIRKELASW